MNELTEASLLELAKQFDRPILQRIWLHDERMHQLLRTQLTTKGDLAGIGFNSPFGVQLLVDAEENPWPDQLLADYRTDSQCREHQEKGLRAWEVLTEHVLGVVATGIRVEQWMSTTSGPRLS